MKKYLSTSTRKTSIMSKLMEMMFIRLCKSVKIVGKTLMFNCFIVNSELHSMKKTSKDLTLDFFQNNFFFQNLIC